MSNTAEGIANSATRIRGIHHVGLSVCDLNQSLEFFKSATTLDKHRPVSFTGTGPTDNEPVASAIIEGPNSYLELMQFDQTAPKQVPVEGPGFTHICFQSPAEGKMYNQFKAASATAVSWGDSPVDLGGYGVHYAYLRDASDIMYEVEEIDRTQFEGPVWIAHVALVSHDIDRLVEFYANMFDIQPYRRVNKVIGPRVDEVTGLKDARSRAAWFNLGNMVLEIWQYISPITPDTGAHREFEAAGYNKFAFEVSDLHAEVNRLKNIGVTFTSDTLATPIGREIYATDPDGNRFSLVQLSDEELSISKLDGISWQTN